MVRSGSRGLIGAMLIAALTLGACGSSTLTAAQFRQQANSICSQANAQLAKLPQPTASASVAPYLSSGLAIERPSLVKLKALKAPSDLSGTAHQALTALDGSLSEIQTTLNQIRQGQNPVRVGTAHAPAIQRQNATARAAWTRIGVNDCAQPAQG